MKVSTSHSSLFSKTLPSFGIRRRVGSLKAKARKNTENMESEEERANREKVQKSLENDIQRSSQMIAEPEWAFPDYEHQEVEMKLWAYFEGRMDLVRNKVEKQQINACEKQFKQIGKLINNKKQTHAANISRLRKLIEDKNREINQYFEEIKRERMNMLVLSIRNKKSKKLIGVDNGDNICLIKENIESIREQIVRMEGQCLKEAKDMDRLIGQWVALLVNIIKKGYYMKDGVKSVFREMVKHNYIPKTQDFPKFIDQTAISCLIKQYKSIKLTEQKKDRERQKAKSFSDTRKVSHSIRTIREITKEPQLKHIYQGTQKYMMTWVKNGSWRDQMFFPRLKENKIQNKDNWQVQEKKRITRTYLDPQIQNKVKSILFGPKVQLLP